MDKPNSMSDLSQASTPKALSIPLPYSISNVVFIESLFAWIIIIGSFFLVAYTFFLSDIEKGTTMMEGVLPMLVSSGFYILLRSTIWKWALGGKLNSIILTYILYMPILLLFLLIIRNVAIETFFSVRTAAVGGWLTLFAAVVSAGIPTLCVVINLFEKGLVDFILLNGKCPACKIWEFGVVKKPCTKQCDNCNSILEFKRND